MVVHGPGVKFFLETLEGSPWKEEVMVPQIFERIDAAAEHGLKVQLCNNTFERLKLDRDKLRKVAFIDFKVAFIDFVPSGVATVAALQSKGFAYMKIG